MTQEEIIKKAYAVYPERRCPNLSNTGVFDGNGQKREGYIKALTDLNLDAIRGEAMHEITDRYEALPKIKGWVARDADGELSLWKDIVLNAANYVGVLDGLSRRFPELTSEDEPIEVELIIRKV